MLKKALLIMNIFSWLDFFPNCLSLTVQWEQLVNS